MVHSDTRGWTSQSDQPFDGAGMESAGRIGMVNISAYAFELVRNRFECEYRGKVTAKGKGEIDMYFALRERIAVPVTRNLPAIAGPVMHDRATAKVASMLPS
jgi:hypothetical protein